MPVGTDGHHNWLYSKQLLAEDGLVAGVSGLWAIISGVLGPVSGLRVAIFSQSEAVSMNEMRVSGLHPAIAFM